MKKLIFIACISWGAAAVAQIPNNGFENWTNMGNYMEPEGYLTPNSMTPGPGYPVTRSTDHFPASVGSYSMRIESNTSLLPDGGYGVVLQNSSGVMNDGPGKGFPITGHPTSLTGYYKFDSQNGDTLGIGIRLYLGGIPVASGEFISDVSQSNWTSFSIPISSYINADSAGFIFSTYYAAGPPPEYMPHGNSVLYLDNINFDNLITAGVNELTQEELSVQPNPANTELSVSIPESMNVSEVKLFDILNREVASQEVSAAAPLSFDVSHCPNGMYFIRALSNEQTHERKIFIRH
jgi:hypothetical protein